MDDSSLKGRVAVVTGGSRESGARLRSRLPAAEQRWPSAIAKETRPRERPPSSRERTGRPCTGRALRCFDETAVTAFFDHVRKALGPVDVLVNNAGIARDSLFIYLDRARWDEVLDTNLGGAFCCIRAVARDMLLRRWGRIINIVSASGDVGEIGQASYCRVQSWNDRFDADDSRANSRARACLVNAVSPGLIETDMTARSVRGAEGAISCETSRSDGWARLRKSRAMVGISGVARCELHHGTDHRSRRRVAVNST